MEIFGGHRNRVDHHGLGRRRVVDIEQIRPVATLDNIGSVRTRPMHRVTSITTEDVVRIDTTGQVVVSGLTPKLVDTGSTVEHIVADPAQQDIVAGLTRNRVIAALAIDQVGLRAADQQVVAAAATDCRIHGIRRIHHVVPAATVDHLLECRVLQVQVDVVRTTVRIELQPRHIHSQRDRATFDRHRIRRRCHRVRFIVAFQDHDVVTTISVDHSRCVEARIAHSRSGIRLVETPRSGRSRCHHNRLVTRRRTDRQSTASTRRQAHRRVLTRQANLGHQQAVNTTVPVDRQRFDTRQSHGTAQTLNRTRRQLDRDPFDGRRAVDRHRIAVRTGINRHVQTRGRRDHHRVVTVTGQDNQLIQSTGVMSQQQRLAIHRHRVRSGRTGHHDRVVEPGGRHLHHVRSGPAVDRARFDRTELDRAAAVQLQLAAVVHCRLVRDRVVRARCRLEDRQTVRTTQPRQRQRLGTAVAHRHAVQDNRAVGVQRRTRSVVEHVGTRITNNRHTVGPCRSGHDQRRQVRR